jgi:6,7-dimethyl-8-ribityllumazine synthase
VLQKQRIGRRKGKAGGNFAIVASRYNARYVDAMLRAAVKGLKANGASLIRIVRVPGAFEIPVAVAGLAKQPSAWSAIICLGVILRGETTHAQHIGEAVSQGLMQLQILTGVPIIHEVLLLENEAQAEARCRSTDHNRGTEAANTALEMKRVISRLL